MCICFSGSRKDSKKYNKIFNGQLFIKNYHIYYIAVKRYILRKYDMESTIHTMYFVNCTIKFEACERRIRAWLDTQDDSAKFHLTATFLYSLFEVSVGCSRHYGTVIIFAQVLISAVLMLELCPVPQKLHNSWCLLVTVIQFSVKTYGTTGNHK